MCYGIRISLAAFHLPERCTLLPNSFCCAAASPLPDLLCISWTAVSDNTLPQPEMQVPLPLLKLSCRGVS